MDMEILLNNLISWFKHKEHIWIKDFFHTQNVSYAKILNNVLKNENLRELFQIALEIQESKLLMLALSSKSNSRIAYYMLECINNSPATLEQENYKPAPVIQFIYKEPKDYSNQNNIIENQNIENPETPNPEFLDTS
jgi:hypothetical protein